MNTKIYEVDFEGMYPVGSCLIIAATSEKKARELAEKTITFTDIRGIKEIKIRNNPQIIKYLSGDY